LSGTNTVSILRVQLELSLLHVSGSDPTALKNGQVGGVENGDSISVWSERLQEICNLSSPDGLLRSRCSLAGIFHSGCVQLDVLDELHAGRCSVVVDCHAHRKELTVLSWGIPNWQFRGNGSNLASSRTQI